MTEKNYGGDDGVSKPKTVASSAKPSAVKAPSKKQKISSEEDEELELEKEAVEKIIKAGKIAQEIKKEMRSKIKKGDLLLSIAEMIESRIVELGGKPAFPVNLSMNEIAAHATPSYNDTGIASGLLKVDFGVHIDGFVADTAFSLDLENSPINQGLIKAAESALEKATEVIKLDATINKIGAAVEKEITKAGFVPIHNLSGHTIEPYNLHAGLTIPNFDNSQEIPVEPGLYAIEPFSTNGQGAVKNGKPSGIYMLEKEGAVRDPHAREVLAYIKEEYLTLPFCSRWIVKKFGARALLAIKRIEEAGLLHHYPQLMEQGNGIVAQAEHTILITDKEKIITT